MNITFVGNYGGANYGDEVVLAGILKCLENLNIQRKNITVFTSNTRYTVKWHKVNAIFFTHIFNRKFYKLNPAYIWYALKNTNLIIIGGGTLLEDKNPQALVHYLTLFLLGKLLHKRIVLFAIGVENLRTSINKEIVRRVCNLADAIYVRDKNSALLLQSLRVINSINLTVDPATTIICKEQESIDDSLKKEESNSDQFNLGISIRECPWNPQFTKNAQQLITYIIQKIIEEKKKTVVSFFCSETDHRVVHRMLPILNERKIPYRIIYAPLHAPLTIARLISKMDLIISMRLHPIITATINSIPCIGLAYMDKVENYCKEENVPYILLDKVRLHELEKYVKHFTQGTWLNKGKSRTEKDKQLKDNLMECLKSKEIKLPKLTDLISLFALMIASSVIALIKLLRMAR